jgi:hypothetical protein
MPTKRSKPKAPRDRTAMPAGERLTKAHEAVLRRLAAAARKPPRRLGR